MTMTTIASEFTGFLGSAIVVWRVELEVFGEIFDEVFDPELCGWGAIALQWKILRSSLKLLLLCPYSATTPVP
jgi:hypothetical protein